MKYLPVSPPFEKLQVSGISCWAFADRMEVVVGAYCELPAPPEPFNYSELVEGHGGEEDFCAVGICQLPCQEAPVLPVIQQVRADFDPEEVLGVCQAGDDR